MPDDSQLLPADLPSDSFDLQVAAINQVISVLYVTNKTELTSSGQMDINVGAVKSDDSSSWPFTRLSSFLSTGGLFYLYHQSDAQTIGEAVYDPEGSWSSNVINILN